MDRRRQTASARTKLIGGITTPLGFYVLALLIVESFLAAIPILAELNIPERMMCVYLGVAMFFLVIVVVTALVWWKPDNLTFDKEAHLEMAYGSNEERVTRKEISSSTKIREKP